MQKEEWFKIMNTFGFSENEKEYNKILKFYSESHRKYHNVTHIDDCLAKCALHEATRHNTALQLAFWYHDVVYNSFRKDNELKSAELAEIFLKRQAASEEMIQRVKKLIMVTLHNQEPNTEEEAYMMDIDFSILGTDNETYKEYTKNIRNEYRWVPWFLYKKKRKEILKMFLDKETLYFTNNFKNVYDRKARLNIENEVTQL